MSQQLLNIIDVPPLVMSRHAWEPFVQGYIDARGGDAMPTLSSFLLQDRIIPLLPEMAVHEVRPDQEILVRMCGTQVVARMGADPTGTCVLSYAAEENRAPLYDFLHMAAEHPCGAYSLYRSIYNNGLSASTEAVLLPLLRDDPSALPLMAAMYAVEPIPSEPGERDVVRVSTKLLNLECLDIGLGLPEQPRWALTA